MGEGTPLTFGELLKDNRLAAKLTQEMLAERAGISARSTARDGGAARRGTQPV
jgi:hypothetical protein